MTVIGRNKNSEAVSGLASQTPLNYAVDMDFDVDGELLLLEGVGLQLSWVDLSADAIEVFSFLLSERRLEQCSGSTDRRDGSHQAHQHRHR